jgi:hypothetical protein
MFGFVNYDVIAPAQASFIRNTQIVAVAFLLCPMTLAIYTVLT